MPRPGRNQSNEKAKDFMGSMKRLIKHLRPWRVLMVLSLILAAASAILALVSPNKLSELTDTITAGLTLKQDKLEVITQELGKSFSEENMGAKIPLIMSDEKISQDDKEKFQMVLQSLKDVEGQSEIFKNIKDMPTSVMRIITHYDFQRTVCCQR